MKTTHRVLNKAFQLNLDDTDYCRGIAYIDLSITISNDADPTTDVALIEKDEMQVEVTSINCVTIVFLDKEEIEIKPPKKILDKLKDKIQSKVETWTFEELTENNNN